MVKSSRKKSSAVNAMGLCRLRKKIAPFNWYCLSHIDVGLWLLEGIFLASETHPPRVGEVAARTEKAAPFVFQHFLLHIL